MAERKVDKQVSISHNDRLLMRDMSTKRLSFEIYMRDALRDERDRTQCNANSASDANIDLLFDDECEDDGMRVIEASVIHPLPAAHCRSMTLSSTTTIKAFWPTPLPK